MFCNNSHPLRMNLDVETEIVGELICFVFTTLWQEIGLGLLSSHLKKKVLREAFSFFFFWGGNRNEFLIDFTTQDMIPVEAVLICLFIDLSMIFFMYELSMSVLTFN